MKVNWRYVERVAVGIGLTAATTLSFIGLAAVMIRFAPGDVIFHHVPHTRETSDLVGTAVTALLLIMLQVRSWIIVTTTAASLANILGPLMWRGAPDYLWIGIGVANLPDFFATLGYFVLAGTSIRLLVRTYIRSPRVRVVVATSLSALAAIVFVADVISVDRVKHSALDYANRPQATRTHTQAASIGDLSTRP